MANVLISVLLRGPGNGAIQPVFPPLCFYAKRYPWHGAPRYYSFGPGRLADLVVLSSTGNLGPRIGGEGAGALDHRWSGAGRVWRAGNWGLGKLERWSGCCCSDDQSAFVSREILNLKMEQEV